MFCSYPTIVDVRQQVALAKNRLLPISASGQVCSEFGVHPKLPAVKALYDDNDLLFFANTGVLSKPVNKDNYYTETNVQLFSHNHMRREAKTIDPYEVSVDTGVLGRMSDVLTRKGHNVGSFSVDGLSVALVGEPGVSDSPVVVGRRGAQKVYLLDGSTTELSRLHNVSEADSGVFAETWSASLMHSLGTNDVLDNELSNVTTNVQFPESYLGNTFETISKLIATRNARGVDVDTFYVEKGGK